MKVLIIIIFVFDIFRIETKLQVLFCKIKLEFVFQF